MVAGAARLAGLRWYFGVIVLGNLLWEVAQLPLYTLWRNGTTQQIAIAVLHCTGGDVVIAGTTLLGSLLLAGQADWPRAGFLPVAVATMAAGVAVTAHSERVNTASGTWTYSDLMPLLPGTGIGLAPLAQWVVVPFLAFVVVRRNLRPGSCIVRRGA